MDTLQIIQDSQDSPEITLTYSGEKGFILARDLGKAILGMELCLKAAADTCNLDYEYIVVKPIEKGSVKTIFLFVKKNKEAIHVLASVATILTSGIILMDRFGSNSFKSPTTEILEAIKDRRVLELCQSNQFRKGAQEIVSPLGEENEIVEINISNQSVSIKCDRKDKFLMKEDEQILPDLKDGDEVSLKGEITRINKTSNDLGFQYQGYNLILRPLEKEQSSADFHNFLAEKEIVLTGKIIRSSLYETPRILVISMKKVDISQTKLSL